MVTIKKSTKSTKSRLPIYLGLIYLLVSLLLGLSLFTYTPDDLPIGKEFTFFSKTVEPLFNGIASNAEANNPRVNMVGALGAIMGCVSFSIFGLTAYLLPIVYLVRGIQRITGDKAYIWRANIGAVLMLIAGSGWVTIVGWQHLQAWANTFHLVGEGGLVGWLIAEQIPLVSVLGKWGSLIVLLLIYILSMVALTGIKPWFFLRQCFVSIVVGVKWLSQNLKLKPKPESAKEIFNNSARPTDYKESKLFKEDSTPSKATIQSQAEPLPSLAASSPTSAATPKSSAPATSATPRAASPKPIIKTHGDKIYQLPSIGLLSPPSKNGPQGTSQAELQSNQDMIIETLKAFGVAVTAGPITQGPTITRYEIYPSLGLRVNKITQLEADLARATKAESIHILAPVPGKDTVGIEIPNDVRQPVVFRELIESEAFNKPGLRLPIALGKDVYGDAVIGDLAAMPHLLVAGATGAGKSVCINAIITSLLYKYSPDELKFIMVDPKVVEMQSYALLPHLIVPVITDPNRVVAGLRWVVAEMERRYRWFAKEGVRNFESFNKRELPEEELEEDNIQDEDLEAADIDALIDDMNSDSQLEDDADFTQEDLDMEDEANKVPDSIPYIVIIIDELADLMQTSSKEVELNISRIAQKARAAGIHLIVATQTPRADVVTGIIKANIPSRIAFQVSSALDSRVILDGGGAEKLVGKGDMLFLPPGTSKMMRSQGAFLSDEEVVAVVDACSYQVEQSFEETAQGAIESAGNGDNAEEEVNSADEDMYLQCKEVVQQEGKASTSLLQRRLRLGYNRAARMVDMLEERGVVGPSEGSKPRQVY